MLGFGKYLKEKKYIKAIFLSYRKEKIIQNFPLHFPLIKMRKI